MKKIGILGWKIGLNSFGITLPYYTFIQQFGEVIILSAEASIRKDLDLLILPGGPDLSTTSYNLNRFDISIGKTCPIRTHFMENRLQEFMDSGVPIFGICLGHQMMAAKVGNSLIPNMYHQTNDPDERYKQVHKITTIDHEFLDYLDSPYDLKNLKVNSIHHQVVDAKNIINAEVLAYHTPDKKEFTDSHIEALVYTGFKGYSVQWHPEEFFDPFSIALIKDLLNPVVKEVVKKEFKLLKI